MISPEQVIIESALRLASLNNWDNVSVRKIAKEMGCSTMKIYSNFESKENLLFEIQKKGFYILTSEYDKVIKQLDTPELRLEKIVLAHVKFATEYPAFYELMFDHKFNACRMEVFENKQRACTVINEVVASLGTEDFDTTFIHLFAFLEGFVKISKELPNQSKSFLDSTLRKIVKNFIKGLK